MAFINLELYVLVSMGENYMYKNVMLECLSFVNMQKKKKKKS